METKSRSFKEKAKERLGFTFRIRSRTPDTESAPSEFGISERVWSTSDVSNVAAANERRARAHDHPISERALISSWDTLTECAESKKVELRKAQDCELQMTNGTTMSVDTGAVDGKKSTLEKRKSRHLKPEGSLDYQVSDRDTLRSIAAKFDTTPSELKKLNRLMSDVIFPGQVFYIPDKDYVPPSPPPKPTSPKEKPTIEMTSVGSAPSTPGLLRREFKDNLFRQLEKLPLRGPGYAQRSSTGSSGGNDSDGGGSAPNTGRPHSISAAEAKKLDQECLERFIKVNVKHITDGQGVVSGVLLVTPNAVMFDPNVSDPLVKEHGEEKYGMIAPMDMIISAAMYHDIAAMKVKGIDSSDADRPRSMVYHAQHCPLYAHRHHHDHKKHTQEQHLHDHNHQHDDILLEDEEEEEDVFDVEDLIHSEETDVVEADVTVGGGHDGKGLNAADENTTGSGEKRTQLHERTNSMKNRNRSIKKQRISSSQRQDSLCSCGAAQNIPGGLSNGADSTPKNNGVEQKVIEAEPQNMDTSATTSTSEQSNMDATPLPDVSDDHHKGASEQTEHSTDDSNGGALQGDVPGPSSQSTLPEVIPQKKPDLLADLDTPADSTPSDSPNPSGSLISRTLGSISSLGSSPKVVSQLVDFSSGLFTKSDESDSVGSNTNSDGSVMCHIKGIDIAVKNAVKLNDRPELFQSLDAKTNNLIPKPAREYSDPPLYLCLKLGMPVNKTVSQHCPKEAYMKKRKKPEYWFSIPRERVDNLYAFFIQWSPDIYGDEDVEQEASKRGFVVIDDDGEEQLPDEESENPDESLDIVHDHFTTDHKRLVRQMTKDWEVVNLDELKRRQSVLDDEAIPMPELTENSSILTTDEHIKKLSKCLPARTESIPWTLKYSSENDGMSLKTLYRNVKGIDCPTLVVVKDTQNNVFGSFLTCEPKMSDHFYGTGESFLFTFYEEFRKFAWTGTNNFIARGNMECLTIGSGGGHSALWLDAALYHGRTQQCDTFNNQILTEKEDFVVCAVEVWGFV